MLVRLLGIVMVVKAVTPANSRSPRLKTLPGTTILAREVQLEKAPLPEALFGIVTPVRAVQPANARFPRLVMVSGNVMPLSTAQFQNARLPTPATGQPPIVLGITTPPPGPMYPVTVIKLLLVV